VPTDLAITIDRSARIPASAQVKDAIRGRIDAGELRPGDRLPPVRACAERLGLVPNTVARAYRELVAEGYLAAHGRSGTFVADDTPEPEATDVDAFAGAYLSRTRAAGMPDAEAVRAVRRAARGRDDERTRS
jgi:DNA-binding transcriptional regulator YhcF (GntR family)